MESEVVKWIWTNLPTLSVALILARLYFKVLQLWAQAEQRCDQHSKLMKRMKRVMIEEHPNRTRDILEETEGD